MATLRAYKVVSLPATPKANAIYYVKESNDKASHYVTDNSGTPFLISPASYVEKVNGQTGVIELGLQLSGGTLSVKTGGTDNVNLDDRYFKKNDHIGWSAVDDKPTDRDGYGLTDVYTKSEVNNITGSLSNLSTNTQSSLVAAINEILGIAKNGMQPAKPLDASSNPNYPAATKGETWRFTKAGKIGGVNGIPVDKNDLLVALETNSGGDQSTAGEDFYILEGNISDATESTNGYGRIATQAQVDAGTDDFAWLTSKTFENATKWNDYATQSWVESKGYLTSHQSLSNYLTINGAKANFIPYKPDYNDVMYTGTGDLDDYYFSLTYAGGSALHRPPSSVSGGGVITVKTVVGSKYQLFFDSRTISVRSVSSDWYKIYSEYDFDINDYATENWVNDQEYLTDIPIATTSELGGVIVGDRLSVTENGTLSATKQTDENFTTALKNKLNGIANDANNYSLPTATDSVLGGVKVGENIDIDSGVITAKWMANEW